MASSTVPLSIEWREGNLLLLDQTRLPHEIKIEPQKSVTQVWESIRQLKVRGAPAIGIAAAYGLLVDLDPAAFADRDAIVQEIANRAEYLETARPTAVNLAWALNRMRNRLHQSASNPASVRASLLQEARLIHAEDRQICQAIAEQGLHLIKPGMNILTHCNAGALAVSELGTALAPLYLARKKGISFHVYVDETRPLLQGSRLTAWELDQSGIDVTLICDNMAAYVMSQGKVDLIITGTDRVAANGDVANKIGTLGLAILARHFKLPLYIACPSSSIDLDMQTGEEIEIEQRDPDEVRGFAGVRAAPENINVLNPAFDVTPANLVTGILTEKGLLTPPYGPQLADLCK
ncbi:MAG: S-methyl-5-thioribose-1-phosphate isomerase [Gammaproteobacteria bacterium]|nr:S-methyl-5-thioribose-1-phosphate isomerase [Gammaproteobacteria bacterium]